MTRENRMQLQSVEHAQGEAFFLGGGKLSALVGENLGAQLLWLHTQTPLACEAQQQATSRPLAGLRLTLEDTEHGIPEAYARSLDLRKAVATVECVVEKMSYRWEYFISRRYQVLVVKVICLSPQEKGVQMALTANFMQEDKVLVGERLDRCTCIINSVQACVALRVLSSARVNAQPDGVSATNAQEIVVLATCGTQAQRPEALRRETVELLTRAERTGYETLRALHEAEHGAFYDRLHFELQAASATHEKPWVQAVNQGKYLLLACGCAPVPHLPALKSKETAFVQKDVERLQALRENACAVARACGLAAYACPCRNGNCLLEETTQGMMFTQKALSHLWQGRLEMARAALEMPARMCEGVAEILPSLPKGWEGGKMQGLRLSSQLMINLEWDNGTLRRLLAKAEQDGAATFRYQGREVTVPLLEGVWQEVLFEGNEQQQQEEGNEHENYTNAHQPHEKPHGLSNGQRAAILYGRGDTGKISEGGANSHCAG